MKIAIIGATNFDSLEYHLHDELTIQGHQVKIIDYKTFFFKRADILVGQVFMSYLERKNKKLLREVINYEPDLVIGTYRFIHPLVVKGVKAKKIKIIHINPDPLSYLQDQQIFAEAYDVYFTKDPYMLKFMKSKIGLKTYLYQEAFNPRLHTQPKKSFEEMEKEANIDVLCFGNIYPYRNRMLRLLKEKEIEITIVGRKAKYFDPFMNENFQNGGIYGQEKVRQLNSAKIVFNNFHYAEIESVNNKFFEITGSGAFQICDYKPIMNKLLPIDPKLVSFETINEAEKLIKYYLLNPEKRWETRKILTSHFQENFSYKHLIEGVFNKI